MGEDRIFFKREEYFIRFVKISYPENTSADEELKEKTIGDELGCQPYSGKRGLAAAWNWKVLSRIIPNRGAFVEGITKEDVSRISMRSARGWRDLCAKWAADKLRRISWKNWKKTFFWSEFHAKKGKLCTDIRAG